VAERKTPKDFVLVLKSGASNSQDLELVDQGLRKLVKSKIRYLYYCLLTELPFSSTWIRGFLSLPLHLLCFALQAIMHPKDHTPHLILHNLFIHTLL